MNFYLAAVSLGSPGALGLPATPINTGIQTIVGTAFLVVGIISVVMVVVGGFQYAISAGDSNSTKRAKDTILYASVGLVVSLMAFAIVSFVIGKIQ